MEKPEVKTLIEVGGVYLTEDAINELKSLQKNDNFGIKEMQESINDTLDLMTDILITGQGDEFKKVKLLMHNLTLIKNSIKKLKKP